MAIRDDHFPIQPIHLQFQIKRHKLLILTHAIQHYNAFVEFNPTYIDIKKEQILSFLKLEKNKSISNLIENYLNNKITPDEEMTWITESNYQSYWIEKQLSIINANPLNNLPPVALKKRRLPSQTAAREAASVNMFIPARVYGRDRSTCLIDYVYSLAAEPLLKNIDNVRKLRNSWNLHKAQLKNFDWITDGNLEKIEFLWSWLTSKNSHYTLNKVRFDNIDSLLIYFEENFNEIEKKYLITNARKTWNQKQYREKNKNLKQCNFLLDENTVLKLNKIAQKYKLTRTEIIEILIDSEAKSERYIKERIERRDLIKNPL